MKETLSGFVAMMPLVELGNTDWSWLGVMLSKSIAEKLLAAELKVMPCYEVATLGRKVDPSLFTSWELLSEMSAHLEDGHVFSGSCLFEEKRVKVYVYRVTPSGLDPVIAADETKENFMRMLDRVAIEIIELFGVQANARMRDRIKDASSTLDQGAYELAADALAQWAAGDLNGVEKAAKAAQAEDEDFLDPAAILVQAAAALGDEEMLVAQQRLLLTYLMSSDDFRALAMVDDMLATAQRRGDTALAADCLKARSAVQGRLKEDALMDIYAEQVSRCEDGLERWLGAEDTAQMRVLRQAGWTMGQAVGLMAVARCWLAEAQVNARLGLRAQAMDYGMRAAALFQVLDSPKLKTAQLLAAGQSAPA